MKKSILALGAAAAVAGFSGVAHAEAFIGSGATPASNAGSVRLAENGLGHYLFAPYFTTQGDNNTLLSVVNTDTVNGKAVKVRFRGAANSDDVMDFTVFLSPQDVWTASLVQGADGLSEVTTPDNSCTLPQTIKNVPFITERLQSDLTDAQKAEHTREGYVEILNMADIRPGTNLFKNIKHKNVKGGTAPCDIDGFGSLVNAGWYADAGAAEAAGLNAPSGGLMGGWQIVKLSNISTYSGKHDAVVAVVSEDDPTPALGQIVFSPQLWTSVGRPANANETADPLLRDLGIGTSLVELTYQDLPDMSTPLIVGADADDQADILSLALSKPDIKNEFVSTAAGASVPGNTDWVVSQPTRRYNVVVAYDLALFPTLPIPLINGIVPNPNLSFYNTYSMRIEDTAFGKILCTGGELNAYDREEFKPLNVTFSPARANRYCGEVFTLSFNDNNTLPSRVLSANLTKVTASTLYPDNTPIQAGWASLKLNAAMSETGLPVTGFAATSLLNQSQNGNYGYTLPHRWGSAAVAPAVAP